MLRKLVINDIIMLSHWCFEGPPVQDAPQVIEAASRQKKLFSWGDSSSKQSEMTSRSTHRVLAWKMFEGPKCSRVRTFLDDVPICSYIFLAFLEHSMISSIWIRYIPLSASPSIHPQHQRSRAQPGALPSRLWGQCPAEVKSIDLTDAYAKSFTFGLGCNIKAELLS